MMPQITMESKLGQVLCELAGQCDSVLEVGTGSGLGSTMCIIEGMKDKKNPLFISLEADYGNYMDATVRLQRFKVSVQRKILSSGIRPYWHPDENIQVQMKDVWEAENKAVNVLEVFDFWNRSMKFDMILFDGGEFTGLSDFLTGWIHAKRFIVLDDCHPEKTVKNAESYIMLMRSKEWKMIHGNMFDRNGWAAFERMK